MPRRLPLSRFGAAFARLRADSAALRVALEDEVEADLEDLLLGCARVRVREGVAGGGELVEEPAGDGDVEPTEVRREGLDRGRRTRRRLDGPLGTRWFFRKNWLRGFS